MLVLGIETATDVCAVGLVDGEREVADFALLQPRQHGARLAGLISAALDAAGAAPEALEGIAVSSGPGSYTGLRIGVSTAKGLCLASGGALASVPTLEALAHASGGADEPALLVVVLPSRRGEVYAACYRGGSPLAEVRAPEAVAIQDLASWLPPETDVRLTGSGARLAADALVDMPSTVTLLPSRPSGLTVARLGRQRLLAGEAEDVAAFEPAYLKPFVSGGA